MKFFSFALVAAAATTVSAGTLGKATFYWQHGVTGYCGAVNPESALIIAASPHSGLTCGQLVHITNTGGGLNNHGIGKSITATVADRCPPEECRPEHLDLSVGAFKALTGGVLDPPGAIGIEFEVVGGWGGRGIY
ncbi:RlpA-like double-psi beta-barrel-containing domain containing protein [Hyaloscypha variabilis]